MTNYLCNFGEVVGPKIVTPFVDQFGVCHIDKSQFSSYHLNQTAPLGGSSGVQDSEWQHWMFALTFNLFGRTFFGDINFIDPGPQAITTNMLVPLNGFVPPVVGFV